MTAVGEGGGIAASWFALRSKGNGKLLQVAPMEDEEAWVIRARAEPLHGAGDRSAHQNVTSLELWRDEGASGLRNLGTGALINFRGDMPGGEGTAVRAHGDTKPRRAALHPSPRTHFELCDVPKALAVTRRAS